MINGIGKFMVVKLIVKDESNIDEFFQQVGDLICGVRVKCGIMCKMLVVDLFVLECYLVNFE